MQTEAYITGSAAFVLRVGGRLTPGGIAALGLLTAALLPREWIEAGPSFCPFRQATGLICPGCGLTRSVVALAHGDLTASLYFHPLGVVFVAALLVVAMVELGFAARRFRADHASGSPSTVALLDRAARGPLPWVAVATLALVWAVRIPLFLNGTWTF